MSDRLVIDAEPPAQKPPRRPAVPVTARENKTEGRIYTMHAPKSALRDYAERSAQVLEGYGEGLVDPLLQTGKLVAEGLGNIATQPIETGKALVWGAGELGSMAIDGWRQIIGKPGQAVDAFVWAGREELAKANEILSDDPKQAGKLVGQIVGGVVVPAAVAGKAAKAKGAAKAKPAAAPKSDAAPNTGAVVLRGARKRLSRDEHRKWLENNGYRNVDDHLKSSDLTQPVELVRFEEGDQVWMYVRDGAKPGSYATIPETPPEFLAIDSAGRHLEVVTVSKPFDAVMSTAAEFPTGVYPGVGGPGGGIQIQLPSNYLQHVITVGN